MVFAFLKVSLAIDTPYSSSTIAMIERAANELQSLAYKETAEWNSMAQIALVAELEDKFDLDFDTDDIFQLKSYAIGKDMLATKFGVEF